MKKYILLTGMTLMPLSLFGDSSQVIGSLNTLITSFKALKQGISNVPSSGGQVDTLKAQFNALVDAFKKSGITYQLVESSNDLYTGNDYDNLSDDNRADYDYWKERLWLEYFDANYSQLDPVRLVAKIQDDEDKDIDLFLNKVTLSNVLNEYYEHLDEYATNMLQNDNEAQARYQKFLNTYTDLYNAANYLAVMKSTLALFNDKGEYLGKEKFSQDSLSTYIETLTKLIKLYPSSDWKIYDNKVSMLQNALDKVPVKSTSAQQQTINTQVNDLKSRVDKELVDYKKDQNAYLKKDKAFLAGVFNEVKLYIQQADPSELSAGISAFKAKLESVLVSK